MTKIEMAKALKIAKNQNIDLFKEDIAIFDGYGLRGFEPIHVTLNQIARIIRWQAQCMDGTLNAEEINAIAAIGKKKFRVIG